MSLQTIAGGTTNPDGSTSWNEGFGPTGYYDATERQAAATRKALGQLPGGNMQSTRWQAFGLGNRPPDPSDVATPGTPAWREAWRQEQGWLTAMAQHGASPSDLGLSPTVGHGLANFSRWGEITDYATQEANKGNWLDPNLWGASRHPTYSNRGPGGPSSGYYSPGTAPAPSTGFGGMGGNFGSGPTASMTAPGGPPVLGSPAPPVPGGASSQAMLIRRGRMNAMGLRGLAGG